MRAAHIDKLDITSDLTGFTVTPRVSGTSNGHAEVVVSKPGGAEATTRSAQPGETLRVPVLNPHLWTPDDPYLYDLKVRLVSPAGKVVDEVSSYAGLRTIGVVNDGKGRPRIALNGKITFLHGPLDQGYWPDGIYTAPTDEALRFDLEQIKAMGMNFVRKHAKVEPARWYYWADKLGLMVWQDMPSLDVSLDIPVGPAPDPVPAAKANFERELSAMVDQLRSVTSIIGWVLFNEGWGEYDTARIANAVKAAGPYPDGEREQWGELLQIARRQHGRRHLRRPHLCRSRPSGAARRAATTARRSDRQAAGGGRPSGAGGR